jgi:hypothetical protein
MAKSKDKTVAQAMDPARVLRVQELRRSNAAGPIRKNKTRTDVKRRALREQEN